MARPKTTKTKYPGVARVLGFKNQFLVRAKAKTPTGQEIETRMRFVGSVQQAAKFRSELVQAIKLGDELPSASATQPGSRQMERVQRPVAEPVRRPEIRRPWASPVSSNETPTVIEYVERFIARRAPSWKPSHQDYMAGALGSAVAELGHMRLDEVRPEDVLRWLRGMRSPDGRDVACRSTMQSYLKRLREVFEMAIAEGVVARNPAHKALVRVPKGRASRRSIAISAEQCRALVDMAGEYDRHIAERCNSIPYMGHQAYIAVAIATGLRSGELTALRWDEHVDLEAGTLDVRENHWNGIVGTRKTGRIDTVFLAPAIVGVLRDHRRRMKAGSSDVQLASGLVFPSKTGTLSTARCKKALEWSCRRLGYPRMVPHDLRHTATTLWNQVASRRVAQLAIGHDNARVHDGYEHPGEEQFRVASSKVARMLVDGGLDLGRESGPESLRISDGLPIGGEKVGTEMGTRVGTGSRAGDSAGGVEDPKSA